jgi:hypothetical protein
MPLEIRATGDWGGAELANVEAVARSVAACFSGFGQESIAILLEPASDEGSQPMTLFAKNAAGEFVVRLNVRGNLWARLAYQFAHEFCHVLANPTTFTFDRFTWIEETLCETGSLFALRSMAKTWAVDPPYPNWRDYASSLADYAAKRISEPAHCLTPGQPFPDWLAGRLPYLEANPGLREDITIIAKELLPLFEKDPSRWRALRYLHSLPRLLP